MVLIAAAGTGWWYRERAAEGGGEAAAAALPLPDKPSIAVLPFDTLSGDPEQEYFADGITEDLITDLSKTSGLFVIARNSSFDTRARRSIRSRSRVTSASVTCWRAVSGESATRCASMRS